MGRWRAPGDDLAKVTVQLSLYEKDMERLKELAYQRRVPDNRSENVRMALKKYLDDFTD